MKRHYKCRVSSVYLVVSVIWISLLVRQLYRLQVDRHEELLNAAKSITAVHVTEVGRRGRIYDFSGNLLVGDSAVYDVSIYSEKYKKYNVDKMIQDLNRVFGTSIETLFNRVESARKRGRASQVQVARDIDIDLYEKIRSGISKNAAEADLLHYPDLFSRLEFTKRYRRFYPTDKLLTHVIGYLGENKNSKGMMIGQVGVEKAWDGELKPKKSGRQSFIRAQNGSMFEVNESKKTKPEHGSDIYLTIHQPIQSFIEQELEKLVSEFNPKTAYIAMANPKTGAILGMAQYPSFDLNDRQSVKPEQLKNRMLLDYFEPGSTMKGISIAGALDAKVVTLNSMEYCENGPWIYGGKSLKDSHPLGNLSVAEVVKHSSNIGTAKIAIKLGEERLWAYFRKFGFGQITDVGLGAEGIGILRHYRNWDKLSITRFPMGQGVSVTPVQMLQAYCALANKGKMMQLHVVDRVVNSNNDSMKIYQPVSKRRVISEHTAKEIVKALSMVTEEGGTARQASLPGISVAGKTGTSQKWDNEIRGYSKKYYIASFIGFLPAEDPEFVLMVVADEPQKSIYGGRVCAPTFKRISEKTLEYIKSNPLE